MTQRITLWCTGKGRHGRVDLASFDVTDQGIDHVGSRRGRSPVAGEGTAVEDGEMVAITVPKRAVVPVERRQNDRGTWRWRCPLCGRDFQLTDANLRRVVAVLAANPVVSADLSLIPM